MSSQHVYGAAAICCIVVVGVIIGLFIWNYEFRYKDNNSDAPNITPAQCSARGGQGYQGYCYLPGPSNSTLLSWDDAEAQCVALSGHLASITSQGANDFATNLAFTAFPNVSNAWIGLNAKKTAGTYVYSDGTSLSFTNWAPSSLSSSTENRCVALTSTTNVAFNVTRGEWVVIPCTTLNAYVCRFLLATPPTAPLGVKASAVSGGATITFGVPTVDGGQKIDNYTVTSWPSVLNVTGKGSPITVYGLQPRTNYSFTVTATNIVGAGPSSVPSNVIVPLPTPPSVPLGVQAKAGDAEAYLVYETPLSDGGSPITSYTVTVKPTGDGAATTQSFPTSSTFKFIVVTGLTNTQQYCFNLTAVNQCSQGCGQSQQVPADVCVIPSATLPGAPTSPTATAGYRNAAVSWIAPTVTGGSPIQAYILVASPVGPSDLPDVINGVAPGTTTNVIVGPLILGVPYSITVIANNSNGAGAPSVSSNIVIPHPVVPFAPTGVVGTALGQAVSVAFLETDNGGETVFSYTVESNDSTVPAVTELPPGANLSVTIQPLIVGSTYIFRVLATNELGNSSWSAWSAPVTIVFGLPGAPVNVTAIAAGQGALVSWTAPFFTGGTNLTAFSLVATPGGLLINVTDVVNLTNVYIGILSVNVSYVIQVAAFNEFGRGPLSSPSNSIIPYPVLPTAPLAVVAAPAPQAASVSWAAPSDDGGVPILSYTVFVGTSYNVTSQGNATELYIPELLDVKKNWTFSVLATNEVGSGPVSGISSPILVEANHPDPPTNLRVSASVSGFVISFTPPANNGGTPITSYTVVISPPDVKNVTGTSSPITVKGLEKTKKYTFQVFAVNAIGASDESPPSEPISYETALSKSLAVPIAGGIILCLLFCSTLIVAIQYCRNHEKFCFAGPGGGSTKTIEPTGTQTQMVSHTQLPEESQQTSQPTREGVPEEATVH